MLSTNSYVYFALKGDDFDTDEVTKKLGIKPSKVWKKGNKGKYIHVLKYTSWILSTDKRKKTLFIEDLVREIVTKLYDKIEIINDLKIHFNLNSELEIVLFIDMNEDKSTPSLGHNINTIEFLYKTKTRTDVDIYRFSST